MHANARTIESFDGTRLFVQSRGEGKPVLLVNGLGGTFAAWRLQIEALESTHRIVSWDYRGLFHSGTPRDRKKLGVADHVRDMDHVLKAEGIERAVLIGWSMGVQVALEYYRHAPDRVQAIALICGTYGHPFRTAFNSPLARHVIPRLLDLGEEYVGLVQPLLHRVVRVPNFIKLVKRLDLVAETLDEEVFRDLAKDYSMLDFRNYIEIMRALDQHTAEDVLPTVSVPALLIAGARDYFTPLSIAHKMREAIPGADLLEVRLGTHYTPVEFPEVVNLRLKKFLRDHRL